MINEPEDDDGGAADEERFNVPGVVNVSPQDKEAIERVCGFTSLNPLFSIISNLYLNLAESTWFS